MVSWFCSREDFEPLSEGRLQDHVSLKCFLSYNLRIIQITMEWHFMSKLKQPNFMEVIRFKPEDISINWFAQTTLDMWVTLPQMTLHTFFEIWGCRPVNKGLWKCYSLGYVKIQFQKCITSEKLWIQTFSPIRIRWFVSYFAILESFPFLQPVQCSFLMD